MCEKIVAPCGIDCFNCEMYKDNITPDFQERISARMGVPKEKITCNGCKDGSMCLLLDIRGLKCKTLECVKTKGVDYCFQCNDFPCEFLMPVADNALKVPHNMKVYNLCTIKRIGLEAFCEKAADIRKTYFGKQFGIGEGGSK